MAGIENTKSYGRLKSRLGRREGNEVLNLLEELDAGVIGGSSVAITGGGAFTATVTTTGLTADHTFTIDVDTDTSFLMTGSAQTITGVKTITSSGLKLQEAAGVDVVTVAVASLASSYTATVPDAGGAAEFVMSAGAQTITGAKTFASSALKLQEAGSTDVVTIAVASLAAGRTYTIPDALTTASFVMTEAAQTINGVKTFGNALNAISLATTTSLFVGAIDVGAATSAVTYVDKVTGITDAAATSIISVVVPNANHAAAIKLTMVASVANFESSRCAEGMIIVSRVAGDDTVAVVATLELAQIATGGTETLTVAYGVSAISGASSAAQSFDIQVTLNTSGSSAAQIVFEAKCINANATGISIAGV